MKHKVRIIPKEEVLANRSNAYEFIDFDKQETIEEAFDRIFDSLDYILFDFCSFEQGAKWQQQRSYSKEEVENIMAETWIQCVGNDGNNFKKVRNKIFKQFKNK